MFEFRFHFLIFYFSVLKDLANLLHIPPPTTYQIVERTTTPPSIKLGLYRNRGKDGKEGAPVDIQSILNGQAKFCKHCDVVILGGAIRKKVQLTFFIYGSFLFICMLKLVYAPSQHFPLI